jgi:hypothetical protein
VVVTGYGCDKACSKYRIETSRYTAAASAAVAPAGVMGQRPGLRQRRRARQPGTRARRGRRHAERQAARLRVRPQVNEFEGQIVLEHWFPGVGPSEGLGIVRDAFDRIFPVGYITVNGKTQARITRIHG